MPQTPLRSFHEELGSRFTAFGGWQMPLQYTGVVSEHEAVRGHAGVFDVSHLGRFRIDGPGTTEVLRSQLCNDVAKIAPGRAQYTMALNDDGGVEDDIIVWRLGQESYFVMPNGANSDGIVSRFREAAGEGVSVDPIRDDTVLLAVQGPDAPGIVGDVMGETPGRFRVTSGEYAGGPFWSAGTGYTGEPGVEVAVPVYAGEKLLQAFIAAGAAPCGLGARDTLRLEMGYPLHGQDLGPSTTPLEAGLGWVVAWDHDFVGRSALEQQRDHGVRRTLVGLRLDGRRVPRSGYAVKVGASSGTVTSGNFSPSLACGIGLAYISPPSDATDASVDIRGTWTAATRIDPPFIAR